MRIRVLAILLFAASASLALSLIRGQESSVPLPRIITGSAVPADPPPSGNTDAGPPAGEAPQPAPVLRPSIPGRDLSPLTPLQQQFMLTAQRGADWMFRMHGVKGRFQHGLLPALKQDMEGDHYLRQVGAACALARAARFTGEERFAVRAAQAVLALLDDTTLDPHDGAVRYTSAPPIAVNRLASAALLVIAICELPAPQDDLLARAEQLCNYIHKQVQANGALAPTEAGAREEDEVQSYPGLALYALLLSHKRRPAGWKLDVARKALPHYRAWWKDHKSMAFVPYHTAACSEAYLTSKEKGFAEFGFEMTDWLCALQYTQIDARRMLWYGGFMSSHDGRTIETPPTIDSAVCAEGMVEACRLAREVGDAARHQRYTETVERCLQFLATLQYTDAGTQHFAPWYRPRLTGGFHPSHHDGNLRIDYTQHAVSALFGYLDHVAK